MTEEKENRKATVPKPDFSNYYTYLTKQSKKEFATLAATYGAQLCIEDIEQWSYNLDLNLRGSQLDDLLHILPDILAEWGTL